MFDQALGQGSWVALSSLVWACQSPEHGTLASSDVGRGQLLVPDAMGRIDAAASGKTGIRGRWTASTDATDCQRAGHAVQDCSRLLTPSSQADEFAPSDMLAMCVVAVVAKVVLGVDGALDWSNMYGLSVALTLNDGAPYDAPAHGVTGFAFHIDSEPPPGAGMRVALHSAASKDAPYWGGAFSESSPLHMGRNEFRFRDVGGPMYVINPVPVDPTRLLSVAFVVPGDASSAKSIAFCIRDFTALFD
jgi:hypothetical protein